MLGQFELILARLSDDGIADRLAGDRVAVVGGEERERPHQPRRIQIAVDERGLDEGRVEAASNNRPVPTQGSQTDLVRTSSPPTVIAAIIRATVIGVG